MLDGHRLRTLAVFAVVCERTARRWYMDPQAVRGTTRLRLERAAAELDLPLPTAPSKPPLAEPSAANNA